MIGTGREDRTTVGKPAQEADQVFRGMLIALFMVALPCLTLTTLAQEKDTDKEKPAKTASPDKKKGGRRPTYLDKEHAPKGKDWIRLFNHKDLSGWKFFPENRPNSWKVQDGVLVNDFKPGEHGTNIYTEDKYEDFELYYEYMVVKDGNSGVFLRGQYEVQIQDDYGQPVEKPKDWGNGGIYGQKAPSKNASKPVGEWQSAYVKMIGKKITVFINGEKIIDEYEPPHPTHLYGELKLKGNEPAGPILIQGDHMPVKFRHVMIKPLKK